MFSAMLYLHTVDGFGLTGLDDEGHTPGGQVVCLEVMTAPAGGEQH